jgi:type I restriction enzyme S subunit
MASVGAADGQIGISTTRPYAEVKKGYTAFRNGDVLFAKVTPCMENGKMAVARNLSNGQGFGSTEFHVLRPREGVDSSYLYHFVSSASFRKEAARHMTGAVGLRRVPSGFLQDELIPLPELDEQRRIVAEIEKQFSRLDEAVANLLRVKANLKRYKAAVLKAAVEGRLVETEASLARREGRCYETGEQLLQRLAETRRSRRGHLIEQKLASCSDGGTPEGWAVALLPQIADIASGNTPAGVLDAARQEGDVPWFKVGDMNHPENQHFLRHADAWLSREDVARLSLRVFPEQSVLFPKRGGAIATNKKRRLDVTGCADLNVMGLTPISSVAAYFFVWFDGVDLGKLSDGSNVPQINNKDIEPLCVPLPPLTEQVRIVAEVERRLSILLGVEMEVNANLQRAKALRQSTLKVAFEA